MIFYNTLNLLEKDTVQVIYNNDYKDVHYHHNQYLLADGTGVF